MASRRQSRRRAHRRDLKVGTVARERVGADERILSDVPPDLYDEKSWNLPAGCGPRRARRHLLTSREAGCSPRLARAYNYALWQHLLIPMLDEAERKARAPADGRRGASGRRRRLTVSRMFVELAPRDFARTRRRETSAPHPDSAPFLNKKRMREFVSMCDFCAGWTQATASLGCLTM